ncbi:MAG: hypothetical protein BZY88_08715 [SAR202 cluster bacterium Io17-Chloro-G9]|nr:MAG: hypothetical protein BZY88_08715 [SAR202 cluster bacterium Io17-Chloro-G9]
MADERPLIEPTREELLEQIAALPAAVGHAYRDASSVAERRLTAPTYDAWLADGLTIARASFRAWEATVEYFKATIPVLDALEGAEDLSIWTTGGKDLSSSSATVSGSYFRSSARFLGFEVANALPGWIDSGRRLYHGTWKSGALAARFFELSPSLLDHVRLSDVTQFAEFLDGIAQHSSELAEECLNIAPECFEYVDEETIEGYLDLLRATADQGWKYAKETQRAAAIALPRISKTERSRFLAFAGSMAQERGKRYLSLLTEGSRALDDLDFHMHRPALDMFEVLMGLSQEAAVEFLRAIPPVLRRVDAAALNRWYQEGVRVLEQNDAAGIGFFKLESARGEAIIQELSATVNLEESAPVLQMYARGLAGSEIQLKPSPDLTKRTMGWAGEARPTTDGLSIFLPEEIALFESKPENFGWYKVLTTHQAGHIEFGSFEYSGGREPVLFPPAKRTPADQTATAPPTPATPLDENAENRSEIPGLTAALSDFEQFFDTFEDRQLAADIFAAVEGSRVDFLVRWFYAGLRKSYAQVQKAAVAGRPAPQDLPLREALVELLIRMTLLDSPSTIPVPKEMRDTVRRVAGVLMRLRDIEAMVEDSAEATTLIYKLLIEIPNQPVQEDFEWQEEDVGELGAGAPDPTAEISDADSSTVGGNEFVPGQGTEQDVPYSPPEEVDYRGDFKPELVQTLANLRKGGQTTDETTQAPPLTEEMIRQLLEKSAEIDLSNVVEGDIDDPSGLFISSLMSEAIEGPDAEFHDEMGETGNGRKPQESEDPLDDEPRTALYPEWDFQALDYKPSWCRIRETVIAEGTSDFYRETLDQNAGLVNEVRRQFEMIMPETYRKEKHLPDGEEFDLDAVIESIVERRAGAQPNEKVYWRRNKSERDVAVIFLLDMSASTAEAIEDKPNDEDEEGEIPDDPRQYLFWLRARREQAKRSYRRIIDLEKEATVLLINALETIGDTYGIYGFSGYGRENVEYYTIKSIEERMSDSVQRRIDGITPLHATRMGPAIRHGTAKLDEITAKTKLLFLISDGRPQDRGYSREGAEKEYAVQDTHMALLEAKGHGIIPFCLTVDRSGHDYMKEMCGDLPYEVLADIKSLPERLPQLYRRLTL